LLLLHRPLHRGAPGGSPDPGFILSSTSTRISSSKDIHRPLGSVCGDLGLWVESNGVLDPSPHSPHHPGEEDGRGAGGLDPPPPAPF
jgi:hypothetical protein